MQAIGNAIIFAGIGFMLLGVIGIFRFRDFYPRLLVASKIDTVGMLTIIIGLAVYNGISFFTGKLFLIMVVMLILNPLVSHILARSAYSAGHQQQNEKKNLLAKKIQSINEEEENL